MKNEIKITVKDNSQEFMNAMKERVPVVLEAIGIHLEGEAKEFLEVSPRRVDTGLLKNSITHAVSGKAPAIKSYKSDPTHGETAATQRNKIAGTPVDPPTSGSYTGTAPNDPEDSQAVYIGTNVEYAPYVHEGTSKMAPNRFLKRAVKENEKQIRKFIKDEFSKITKEI